MIRHLALVSETQELSQQEVNTVAAALGKQISRDFSPLWNIPATLHAFATLDDVPTGYWPIIVMENIGVPGAAGIHLDDDGKPFGLVNLDDGWSLTASHEALEMLGDPLGNTLRAAPSIHPDQGYDVEYLVEVCDPSEAWEFGYDVNGIRVSDFYTPDYFLPFPGKVRYSYTGAIDQPRQVLKGGYLSWLDPSTGRWWQQIWFSGSAPQFRDLGQMSGSLDARSWLDEKSGAERFKSRPLRPKANVQRTQLDLYSKGQVSSHSKSGRLKTQISGLVSHAKKA